MTEIAAAQGAEPGQDGAAEQLEQPDTAAAEATEAADGDSDGPDAEADASVVDALDEEPVAAEPGTPREIDRGSPPEAEPGAPEGLSEEGFQAYVSATTALLFASPEALSTNKLLELLRAGELPGEEPEAGPGAAEAEADDEAQAESDTAGDSVADSSAEPVEDGGAETPEAPAAFALGRAGVLRVLAEIAQRFEQAGLPIVVREIASGWRLFTDQRLGEIVARLDRSRRVERISQAALETLAIIAYRQPVTKAEIEAIRGVQAGPVLRQLVDRRLAQVTGRADQPGSPLLYGTGSEFLDRFGLASIDDLPRDGELARD